MLSRIPTFLYINRSQTFLIRTDEGVHATELTNPEIVNSSNFSGQKRVMDNDLKEQCRDLIGRILQLRGSL